MDKKPYEPPKLTVYGTLVELTQLTTRPGLKTDAGQPGMLNKSR